MAGLATIGRLIAGSRFVPSDASHADDLAAPREVAAAACAARVGRRAGRAGAVAGLRRVPAERPSSQDRYPAPELDHCAALLPLSRTYPRQVAGRQGAAGRGAVAGRLEGTRSLSG